MAKINIFLHLNLQLILIIKLGNNYGHLQLSQKTFVFTIVAACLVHIT